MDLGKGAVDGSTNPSTPKSRVGADWYMVRRPSGNTRYIGYSEKTKQNSQKE